MLAPTGVRVPLWERACPRWGRHIQHQRRLTHRHREQARSHRKAKAKTEALRQFLQGYAFPCGSEPARDGAGTFSINGA
ncbi:hypothetical protein DKY63_31075 [Pseudomonas putida]|uniref:Uncharacterized protein n=1 Tax=Pseudomonas putida TaxID=303 RepID=A0A2Z4RTV5_PSEPU|nr:hypothetical protein DKY63_31075 [Pseudomonas putida]